MHVRSTAVIENRTISLAETSCELNIQSNQFLYLPAFLKSCKTSENEA